jgi:protease-4
MSLETDLILDRRRLKRGLVTWRVVAIAAVVLAALALLGRGAAIFPGHRYVAVLHVDGIITDDETRVAAVSAVGADPHAAALMVVIDSPGGSFAGGEALHDAIATVARAKPVVAVMGGTAASAGYMIAVPAARIFARNATITGSIGVIMEAPEASGLLNKLGIDVQTLVSGPLKGQPSFTAPMTDAGHQALQSLLMNLYSQFVTIVADGRHMSPEAIRNLADGRAYTGQEALPLHLIDEIGGMESARAWLARMRSVPVSLPLQRVGRGPNGVSFLGIKFSGVANLLFSQTLMLDGAVALWQP